MNKIKSLMLAMMVILASATFTACGSDDDDNKKETKPEVVDNQSNYDRYQQAVNQIVNTQKKSDKVILVVAFGSTWEQAYDTFEGGRRLQGQFPRLGCTPLFLKCYLYQSGSCRRERRTTRFLRS